MRTVIALKDNWRFTKNFGRHDAVTETVSLPHSWNAIDGQDGGADYFRGSCRYETTFDRPAGDRVYVEVGAANSVAHIYVNGIPCAQHKGGYSRFRADITGLVSDRNNRLAIDVDNSDRGDIYPQKADFTFYGGLYRDVNIIGVPEAHFDLMHHGDDGVYARSAPHGEDDFLLQLHARVTGAAPGMTVQFSLYDAFDDLISEACAPAESRTAASMLVLNARRWHGVKDPYLYTVAARLLRHNEVIDEVIFSHGFRTFSVDPQKGFLLNGEVCPLRGVSRHQDMLGVGNALQPDDAWEDMRLIREMGANTVRLAHYQQDQSVYDACDAMGLVVWAEIPFITIMSPEPKAHDDCIRQLTELIWQNRNHPSIICWGIANEITFGGEKPQLEANLRELDALCRRLDPDRLTTIAQVTMLRKESPLNFITDMLSYNHSFGWYLGTLEDNERWLDEFHAMYPDRPLGLSEYGCEGIISWHSATPTVRDYSEEYQALYHEHMARIIDERPWLWATHVWNMFDFGCDARNEGGVAGRNNKGLVTFDRSIRKDAFYLYKAYWSDEPFVHLCGRRFSRRTGSVARVKVYSNADSVTLLVNGKPFATKEGRRIFEFDGIPLSRHTFITARADGCTDSMTLQKVDSPEQSYILPKDTTTANIAANWFNPDEQK